MELSPKIVILDYKSGNIMSVKNAFKKLGFETNISKNELDLQEATHIVLVGVGSYDNCMQNLKENFSLTNLKRIILDKNKPFLGICVGMQIMSEVGYENKEYKGLGYLKGKVKKLQVQKKFRLPHVGWNNLTNIKNDPILQNIDEEDDFYFVHSYVYDTSNSDMINQVVAYSNYGTLFPSVVRKNNIVGVQFHPEKSQRSGLQILKNFINN